MNITELLRLRNLDTTSKIKLVRHQDQRHDLWEVYRSGHFDIYQSFQAKPVFNCEYVVAFMGLERALAQFIGVYRVTDCRPAREIRGSLDYPYPHLIKGAHYFYTLTPVSGFEDFKDRVIIDWGGSPRAWHQWLKRTSKEVIEVLPKGHVEKFPGYFDFTLTYDKLVGIIRNPDAHREWHRALSSVAGVYLIVDSKTSKQYVGAAYGDTGIWGRWAQYAKTGHGGNDKLRALIDDDPNYAQNFRFTILHTLLKTAHKDEAFAWEVRYKNKLGTKAFGLNSN